MSLGPASKRAPAGGPGRRPRRPRTRPRPRPGRPRPRPPRRAPSAPCSAQSAARPPRTRGRPRTARARPAAAPRPARPAAPPTWPATWGAERMQPPARHRRCRDCQHCGTAGLSFSLRADLQTINAAPAGPCDALLFRARARRRRRSGAWLKGCVLWRAGGAGLPGARGDELAELVPRVAGRVRGRHLLWQPPHTRGARLRQRKLRAPDLTSGLPRAREASL